MICTAIIYLPDLSSEDDRELENKFQSGFGKEIIKYIKNTSSTVIRRTRCAAYISLRQLLEEFFSVKQDIDVNRGKNGKPYITDIRGNTIGIEFNISHSGSMIAITITDEQLFVGVDVQEKIPDQMVKRLENRFFTKMKAPEKAPDVEYKFFEFSVTEALISAPPFPETESSSGYTSVWALAESVMKCDGRGFAAIGDINTLTDTVSAEVISFKINDKEYCLSTAVKTK